MLPQSFRQTDQPLSHPPSAPAAPLALNESYLSSVRIVLTGDRDVNLFQEMTVCIEELQHVLLDTVEEEVFER